MKKLALFSLAALAVTCAAAKEYERFEKYEFPTEKYGIMQNEDCTQFFYTFQFPATEEGLKRYLDDCYLAPGHQIREFLLNPQAQRFGYQSKVGGSFIDALTFTADGKVLDRGKEMDQANTRAMKRYKVFADAGINPWVVWTKHLRDRGVSPWISIRMNDMHAGTNHDSRMNCDFYKANTDKLIAPYRGYGNTHGLDFTHPEVRKFMLDCIQETLDLCEPDGLDLDFMRWGTAFKRGYEQRGRAIMTEFIREVRRRLDALEKKSGHRVRLCVRIHADPVDAYASGFDAGAWADEGLIDILAVGPFFDSSFHEIPIWLWRRIVGDKVLIAPSFECSAKPYPGCDRIWNTEFLNGLANVYFSQGADRIYLFNHFGNEHERMASVGNPEMTAAAVRRHPVMFNDMAAPGRKGACYLPVTSNGWSTFRLDVGASPAADRPCFLVLASREASFPELVVYLNGEILKKSDKVVPAGCGKQINCVEAWEIPPALLQSEGNIIEVVGKDSPKSRYRLDWVEIYIGKAGQKFRTAQKSSVKIEPQTIEPDLREIAENRAAGFVSDYRAEAKFADGVLKLDHSNPQNGYAAVQLVKPAFLEPGAHKIEVSGEVRTGAPSKDGDQSFLIALTLPDTKQGYWMATAKFAPGGITLPDGKKIETQQGFVNFKIVFNPVDGKITVTADGKTASSESPRFNANKPSIFFGDGSGGISGSAEVRSIRFRIL